MFDTLVRGGLIGTPEGLKAADLALRAGRVAAWLEPGAAAVARTTIDATGLVVLPGLVDAHVHFRDPGLTHKEDFGSGSAAAAMGGVTTALVMPTDLPPTFTAAEWHAKAALVPGRAHVDIGLQAAATEATHVSELAAAGAVSLEVFLGDMPPALLLREDTTLRAVMRACRTAGIVLGVTPADDGVIAEAEARLRRPGGDPLDFFASRPPASEAKGTRRALEAAAETGVALHLRQISCVESLALVQQAQGLDLSAETTPHYLLLEAAEIRRQGPWAKILPPLRGPADQDALWAALRPGGGISLIATDHAPHTRAEKQPGEADIWAAPGGFPGVQTLLPLLLDSVAQGRLGWGDLVRLTSSAPARRFGLAGKGSLAVGADADFVLVDPQRRGEITDAQQMSRAGRTPFAGRGVTGWPIGTWLRGAQIADAAGLVGAPRGRVLRRAGQAGSE